MFSKEAFHTKKVRYKGEFEGDDRKVTIMALNVDVAPGDEISVPDDFSNALFDDVPAKKTKEER